MKIDIPTLIGLFNKWEQKYPVDTWTVEDVYIWPILKKNIYFSLYREIKDNKFIDGNKVINFFKDYLKLFFAFYKLKTLGIKKTDYLFSGAPSHRINWKNKQFNRFFDPIMDYLEVLGKSSYLLEYQKVELNDSYKSQRVFNLVELLPLFEVKEKKWKKKLNSNDLPDLESFLIEVKREAGLDDQYLKAKVLKDIDSILQWSNLFKYFIKKTEAKFSFGLCYYNNEMYGMNLASSQLGVKSIDMQHGLQGFSHPAYYFTKLPKSGYNILPKDFWVWETSSYNNINDWTKNSFHKAILGGNPWIDFIKADKSSNKIKGLEKPMILVTLQPPSPFLDESFMEVIKSTYEKYSWWLRAHPRMSKLDISEMENKLQGANLLEYINVKEASTLPLPILLSNCKLHISGSSGSIAEAAMMDRTSVITEELGVKSFKYLIDRKVAVACLSRNPSELTDLIENILNKPKPQMEKQDLLRADYKTIIDEFIKKT